MDIVNHNKNNHYDINTYVMSGTITMTLKEYKRVYAFLMDKREKAIENNKTYARDSLENVKHHQHKEKGNLFSLGVYATQLLCKKYKLNNYKNQNYGIKIV
jgi:HPt (histidine-containing phosphotransfer) domain-containing protein